MAQRPEDDPIHPRSSHLAGAGEYMGVGLQFGASIALFLFAGMWLDGRLGTDPWFLILGVVIGGSAGFWSVYRKLMADQRERDRLRREEREKESKP